MSRKLPGSAIVPGTITVTQITGGLNDTTNASYAQANTARTTANDAYGQANTARADANTTFGTINTTFGTVNSSFGTVNTNYQAAYAQANTARTTANDAYGAANTKLSTSGGSISGDLAITGNLTVQGNATTINVSNLSVNDSIILLSTNAVGDSNDIGFIGHFDRGATETHAGLIRKATENRFYLFDNYEVEPSNNVIDVAGNNFRVGNLRLGIINANSFVTAAGLDVTGQANAAYGQANSAYGAANNRVLKAGDTMTGQLNISSGGLLVTGNANFDSATLFVDSVNDRIGIGTTSPGTKLHILDSSGPVLRMVRTSNRFDIEADNNAMGFVSRDSATANAYFSGFTSIGIGTTSPSGLWSGDQRVLHLFSSGSTAVGVRISSVNATAEFFSSAGSVEWGLYSSSTSSPFTIYTNGSERLRITSGGNVGIGTASPQNLFHVSGSSQNVRFSNFSTDSAGLLISYQNSSTHGLHLMYRPNDATCYIDSTYQANAGTVYGDLIFRQNVAGTMTPRMTIKADGGKVGINTTSPAVGLVVADATANDGNDNIGIFYKGTSGNHESGINWYDFRGQVNAKIVNVLINDGLNTPQAHLDFRATNGSTTLNTVMRLLGNGNVGIGTASPSQKLHVDGGSALIANGSSNTALWLGNSAYGFELEYSTGKIHTTINSAKRVTVDNSGNVGIGTNGPINKLQVVGTIGVSDTTSGNRGRFFWTTTGFTGIGLYNDDNSSLVFGTTGTARFEIDVSGHALPYVDNTYNLGSASKRWANIYIADLNMSNKGSQNNIDGTWGEWTIQEGETKLYLINRRNGKKYSFVLSEEE